MQMWATTQKSIAQLFRQLIDDAKSALKQELELAKKEVTEKVARYGRDSAFLAAGGVIALVGLIIFLAGLGLLLAFAFSRGGMDPLLAAFAGMALVGVLAIAGGTVAALAAVKKLKQHSIVPEKAIHEAKELKAEITGTEAEVQPASRFSMPQPDQSSEEVQAEVRRTRRDLGEGIDELKNRLTVRSLSHEAVNQVKAHPLQVALAGAGVGLAGYLVVRKKHGHSHRAARRQSLHNHHPDKVQGTLAKLLTVVKIFELINRARGAVSSQSRTFSGTGKP